MKGDTKMKVKTNTIKVKVPAHVFHTLNDLVGSHIAFGAPNQFATVEDLAAYVLGAIADGFTRPDSWEQEVLSMMGLEPNG
jgi:hypothetical protein